MIETLSTHTETFKTMGTVASLRLPREATARQTLQQLFDVWEERFSLWRPLAEAAQVARHELPLNRASKEFRSVYFQAVDWEKKTNGAFTPSAPDGTINLCGIVKSLAIESAAPILDDRSPGGWCLNVGGDVLVRQRPAAPWTVGIIDPSDRTRLRTTFTTTTKRTAVATSGNTERGRHIWSQNRSAALVQVTVCASDIVTADVLATAIMAGGYPALENAADNFDIDYLAVRTDGLVYASSAFTTPQEPEQQAEETHPSTPLMSQW